MKYKNVLVLSVAQAMLTAVTSALIFVGAFVGRSMSGSDSLATLPVSLLIVGIALGSAPAGFLQARFGRKAVFVNAALLQITCILIIALAIHLNYFYLFSVACLFVGSTLSVINQFRFAAMESVPVEFSAKATSLVMLGNIAAAWAGPEIIERGSGVLFDGRIGSFICLAIFTSFGLICMLFYNESKSAVPGGTQKQAGNQFQALGNPTLLIAFTAGIVGFAVMSFMMTATPLSMHDHGHSMTDAKHVIQHHIMMMFLPSLITPKLIGWLGHAKVISLGLAIYCTAIAIALSGIGFTHYWLALVFIGVGWNLLFITGTVLVMSAQNAQNRFFLQSFNDALVFGAQATATMLSAVVLSTMSWSGVMIISLTATVLAAVLIFAFYRAKKITEDKLEAVYD